MQASWQDSLVFRAGFALAAGAYGRDEPTCFQHIAWAAKTIFLPEAATLRTIPGPGRRAGGARPVSGAGRAGRSGEALEPWRSTASPQLLGCWGQRRLVL